MRVEGFPGNSASKESTCNAGDLGSIPGLERSPGEGIGDPLQYSGLENSVDCNSPWGRRVGHFWETFTFTCERWNYKTLRKKIIGVNLCVFWLSVGSYLWHNKWQENRDKLDFIKKLSFLCFKWHHWECEKTTRRMQKIFVSNIFAKRFVSKYIYENSYSSVIKT